ncbi:MAG: sulfatase [bacterium]
MTDRNENASRPNVVFVMMDDMGYGDMGCYGADLIRTPTMDAIAKRGVRFTQMYSAPICTPARAQLLTGQYAQRLGLGNVLFPHDTHGLPAGVATMGGVLREAGYRTACIGKWHLGCRPEHFPTRHGFDYFYGLLYSNDMAPLRLYENETVVDEAPDQAFLTRNYTEQATRFIEASSEEPFLLYLAHTMPHIPLHVEERFRGVSKASLYGDTIECIDSYLADLMKTLQRLDLLENTLVIVTSDNGPWFEGSTATLRGRKFEVFEGGVRMPFVAQWGNRIPPGSRCDSPAHLMDMVPTFARLAGGEVPPGLDGIDIADLMLGAAIESPDREFFYYFQTSLNAMRRGRWKLHVGSGHGEDGLRQRTTQEMPQLFDLAEDPGERYNLASRNTVLVDDMMARMTEFDQQL